jgi:hypothetical protein
MLRITVQESERAQTIKLEGKIVGPWVEEFNCTWQSLEAPLGSRELQLDLRGVAFVDAKGRELLRKIYQKTNACFLTNSLDTVFCGCRNAVNFERQRKGTLMRCPYVSTQRKLPVQQDEGEWAPASSTLRAGGL